MLKLQNIIYKRGDSMLEIKFRYADAQSNWKWRTQQCVVPSIEECKKIYGLGKDCKYEILDVKKLDD